MKVKVKTLEEMPDDEKCCAGTIEAMKPFLDREIEVEPNLLKLAPQICCRCGASLPARYGYRCVAPHRNAYYAVDFLHLDEGQLN